MRKCDAKDHRLRRAVPRTMRPSTHVMTWLTVFGGPNFSNRMGICKQPGSLQVLALVLALQSTSHSRGIVPAIRKSLTNLTRSVRGSALPPRDAHHSHRNPCGAGAPGSTATTNTVVVVEMEPMDFAEAFARNFRPL